MNSEFLLVGCGSCGCEILNKISLNMISVSSLKPDPEGNEVNLTIQNRSPELGKNKSLNDLIRSSEIVFLCCGLGGKTGAPATALIAHNAIRYTTVVCVTVMPFRAERKRFNKAFEWLKILRNFCNTIILVENDWLVKKYPNLTLSIALNSFNGLIGSTLTAMIEAISLNRVSEPKRFRKVLSTGGISTMLYGEGKSCSEAINNGLLNPLCSFDISPANSLFLHSEAESRDEAEAVANSLKSEYDVFLSFRKNSGARFFGVVFGLDSELDGSIE